MTETLTNEQLFAEGRFDELFERNQAFITRIFSRYPNIYIEFEEFYSLSSLAFTKSLSGYEPSKGKFITYWGTAIHNEIIRYLQQYKRKEKYGLEFLSLDSSVKEGDQATYHELVADLSIEYDTYFENTLVELVEEGIKTLTRKQQLVFKEHLKGFTQQEIADNLRVTRQAVSKCIINAKKSLASELAKSGIYV